MTEEVVLVDDAGAPIGRAEKSVVHTSDTPLHLAFSCYLTDRGGNILLTRRALTKNTWPGVWTNSFCGHPGPGEALTDAVCRRAREELGVEPSDIRLVLSDFRYRATDASGIVENEICPVYVARLDEPLRPHPGEVMEWHWVTPDEIAASLKHTPFLFTPWLQKQFPLLLDAAVFTT